MPSTALPWYPAIAWTEEWISLVNTTIAPLLVRRYLAAYFFPRTQHGRPDRAAIDAAPPNMEQHFSVLDRAVAKTSHLVGGTFTLADRNLPPILFLMVNEGYLTTTGEALICPELCAEAIRLGRMLCEINARVDGDGALVTLEKQDRSLRVRDQMREGSALIDEALRIGRIGPYQLQAAIAA